jgi:hypothetical protein
MKLYYLQIPFDFNKKYLFSGRCSRERKTCTCIPLLVNNDLHLVISGQISDLKYQDKIIDSAKNIMCKIESHLLDL